MATGHTIETLKRDPHYPGSALPCLLDHPRRRNCLRSSQPRCHGVTVTVVMQQVGGFVFVKLAPVDDNRHGCCPTIETLKGEGLTDLVRRPEAFLIIRAAATVYGRAKCQPSCQLR